MISTMPKGCRRPIERLRAGTETILLVSRCKVHDYTHYYSGIPSNLQSAIAGGFDILCSFLYNCRIVPLMVRNCVKNE